MIEFQISFQIKALDMNTFIQYIHGYAYNDTIYKEYQYERDQWGIVNYISYPRSQSLLSAHLIGR